MAIEETGVKSPRCQVSPLEETGVRHGGDSDARKPGVSDNKLASPMRDVVNLGEQPPAPLTRQITRSGTKTSFDKAKKLGKFDTERTETEEEYQDVERRSVVLRESCAHDIVKQSDMKVALRDSAIDEASIAIVRTGANDNWDNEIAARIKKRMDKQHPSMSNGRWHCIVGPDFGSFVSHEKGSMIYLYLPRQLSPVERVDHEREQRRLARMRRAGMKDAEKPKGDGEGEGEDESTPHHSERNSLDMDRTGPLIGEGTTTQRMIGILLWRT